MVQLSERVAVRRERRWAAEAVQQALRDAKAQEQEQFERIKAEFSVDTATVRCTRLCSLCLQCQGEVCCRLTAAVMSDLYTAHAVLSNEPLLFWTAAMSRQH